MRWTAHVVVDKPSKLAKAVKDHLGNQISGPPAKKSSEEAQVKAAVALAKSLMGELKDEPGLFAVTLGGNVGATDLDAAAISVAINRGPGIVSGR